MATLSLSKESANLIHYKMIWMDILKGGLEIALTFLNNKKSGDAFVDAAKIGSITRKLVHEKTALNIDFFFLVLAHNSGGDMSPHDFKYISLLGGHHKLNNFDENSYRNIEIDFDGSDLLGKVYKRKKHSLNVNDMPDGRQKDFFKHEGVKFAKYYFLKHTKRRMWYCVCGTTQDGELLDSHTQSASIELSVNEIKNIIKQY